MLNFVVCQEILCILTGLLKYGLLVQQLGEGHFFSKSVSTCFDTKKKKKVQGALKLEGEGPGGLGRW